MKVKIWRISGYKGQDECDSKREYNVHLEVPLDARFKKDEIIDIFLNHFGKKYRYVEIVAEEICETFIERNGWTEVR